MEALVAFSVACNVMQVVDFSCNAIKVYRQISKHGSTQEYVELDRLTKKVQTSIQGLQDVLQQTQGTQPQDKVEQDLMNLARDCATSARNLHVELQKIQTKGGWRETTKAVLRNLRKHSEVERLTKTFEGYQRLLETTLLTSLRKRFDATAVAQQKEFQSLGQDVQKFIQMLSEGQTRLERLAESHHVALKTALDNTSIEVRAQTAHQVNELKHTLITEAQRQKFLNSLRYDEIFARQNQISPPQHNTFHWLFEEGPDHELDNYHAKSRPPSSFPEWLESGRGIYWIDGKPGSGKSSLMHFILKDSRTMQHFRLWQPLSSPLIVSFFFWLVGSTLQKNLCGLVSSLIYQILTSDQLVTDDYLQSHAKLLAKCNILDWSVSELLDLLFGVLQGQNQERTILILIDGLDEFDQHHDDFDGLWDILKRLSTLPAVKICTSGRPEAHIAPILIGCPSLKLQDLTFRDIELYVNEQISKYEGQVADMNRMSDERLGVSRQILVESFVFRAQGVFLWIRLAIRDVLQGIRKHDSYAQILKRLSRLPPEIDALYENMLCRLGPDRELYKNEASLYLKIACWDFDAGLARFCIPKDTDISCQEARQISAASKSPLIHAIASARVLRVSSTYDGPCFDLERVDRDVQRTITRINVCCNGLLEIIDADGRKPGDHVLTTHRVQLAHRTVRDFLLEKRAGQLLLNQRPSDEFTILCSLLQSYLSLSKVCFPSKITVSEIVKVFCHLVAFHGIPQQYFFQLCQFIRSTLSLYYTRRELACIESCFLSESSASVKNEQTPIGLTSLAYPLLLVLKEWTSNGKRTGHDVLRDYLLLCVFSIFADNWPHQSELESFTLDSSGRSMIFHVPINLPLQASSWFIALTGTDPEDQTNPETNFSSRHHLPISNHNPEHLGLHIYNYCNDCPSTYYHDNSKKETTTTTYVVTCEGDPAYVFRWTALDTLEDPFCDGAENVDGLPEHEPICCPLLLWKLDVKSGVSQSTDPQRAGKCHAVKLLPEDWGFVKSAMQDMHDSLLVDTIGLNWQTVYDSHETQSGFERLLRERQQIETRDALWNPAGMGDREAQQQLESQRIRATDVRAARIFAAWQRAKDGPDRYRYNDIVGRSWQRIANR